MLATVSHIAANMRFYLKVEEKLKLKRMKLKRSDGHYVFPASFLCLS